MSALMAPVSLRENAPSFRLSSTVICGNIRRPSGDCASRARPSCAPGCRPDRSPSNQISPATGLQQPRDRAQRGRLAGAVGADQGDDLRPLDGEADALDGLDPAVGHHQVLDLKHRRSHSQVGLPLLPASDSARRAAAFRCRPRSPGGRSAPRSACPRPAASPRTRQQHPVAQVEDEPHVVLDHDDGQAEVPDLEDQVLGLPRSPAGSCRPSARRAAAASGRWPAPGRSPGAAGRRRAGCATACRPTCRQPDEVEQLLGPLGGRGFLPPVLRARAGSTSRASVLVRQYRPTMTFSSAVMLWKSRMFWNVRAMPGRTTSRGLGGSTSPANRTSPDGRLVQAGEAVEEGRLAGAVRSDQADDLARMNVEADVVRPRSGRRTASSRWSLQQQRGRIDVMAAARDHRGHSSNPFRSGLKWA